MYVYLLASSDTALVQNGPKSIQLSSHLIESVGETLKLGRCRTAEVVDLIAKLGNVHDVAGRPSKGHEGCYVSADLVLTKGLQNGYSLWKRAAPPRLRG